MDVQYMAYWLNGDGTEQLMEPDLPLSDVQVVRQMNGLGRLTATLPPEYGTMTAFANRPVIQEWATAIYVELSGLLFDGFMVVEVEDDNEKLVIDAVGWIGYGEGQPWSDRVNHFNVGSVPAAVVIKRIWDEVQRLNGANIGLECSLGSGWPLVGEPIWDEVPRPAPPGPAPRNTAGKQPVAPKYPSAPVTAAKKKAYDQARRVYQTALKKWQNDTKLYQQRKKVYDERLRKYKDAIKERQRMIEDAKFKMNYWSTQSLLDTFTDLMKEIGASYRVDHSRSGNTFTHTLICRPGRLGARRHNIHFIEGENVYSIPNVTRQGDEKVTSAVILGQGDGSSTRWRQTSRRAGGSYGLRRARVFVDKTLTRDAQLAARANEVLATYADPIEIEEFIIVDHDLAPVRVFDVGDEVLLQTFSRRAGNFERWVTIQAITLQPEKGLMSVKVVPAD